MIATKFIRLVLFFILVSFQVLVSGRERGCIYMSCGILPLGKDSITWNDSLQEVVVIGDSIFCFVDKEVYRITDYMRRNSNNTGEVLGMIPGMNYSRFDQSLSYYGDKNIVILVDSIEKNANYVKRLHHLRFDKVEIISQPNGQYSGFDVVVNLHRVPDYEGYENDIYASEQLLLSALDHKLFDATDWFESFTYTKGNWNFNLFYDGNFYQRGRVSYGNMTYMHNDYKELVIPNADNSSNGGNYTRANTFSLAADYQIDKRNSFSMLYKYDYEDNDIYAHRTSAISDIVETYHDTIQTNMGSKAKGYVHSVGLYYRGGWSKWNYNLTFNYVNHTWNSLYHISKTSGYASADCRHQRMNHTVSKFDVNRKLIDNKLYFASSYTYFWRRYDQFRLSANSVLGRNTLTYHNLWGSLSYNISRTIGVSMSGAAFFYDSETGNRSNKYNTYSGALGFVSTFRNHSQLRLSYGCNASNPRLDQLSTYGYFTDSLNWKVGNPELKASLSHNFEIRYKFLDGMALTTKVMYAPRNFVGIIESGRGMLQNGTEGYFAITQEQNGKNLCWINNLNIGKRFGNFSVSANVAYSYLQSKYSGYKKSAGAWTGNCELTYELNPSEVYLTALYKMINNHTLTPQSVMNDRYDVMGFSVTKSFCNDNLELILSYVTPLHFTSITGNVEYTTPAFIAKGFNENKFHVNNVVFVSVSYKILGGKSIRKYKREMSEEK